MHAMVTWVFSGREMLAVAIWFGDMAVEHGSIAVEDKGSNLEPTL